MIGLAFITIARVASAQPAVGPEFLVNGTTEGYQYQPAIASDALGNFIVVWAGDYLDGSYTAIVGQRFDRNGNATGTEFVINTFAADYQLEPSVAMHSSGAFVVAWQSFGQLGAYGDIFAQRFSSTGARIGGEFQVNTDTAYDQREADVAYAPGGEFVVTWTTYDNYSYIDNVAARRYDAAGDALGGEFRVNAPSDDHQGQPAVATLPAGGFVVVWNGYGNALGDAAGAAIVGRRFDAAGNAQGSEFLVNTYTTYGQNEPDVAVDGAGNFVVVWESAGQDEAFTGQPGIFGQLFEADGDRMGIEFLVNTYTTGDQRAPAVARETNGDFVVTWQSTGQVPLNRNVFAQRFRATGARVGTEFQANTYTTNSQDAPVIASLGQEKFVVAWTSWTQDGSGPGIFAQRFGDLIFKDGFNGP